MLTMSTRKFATAALCLVAFTGAAAEDNYLAPAFVYTDDGVDRLVDDGASGGQIALGHFISDYLAIEGLVGFSSLNGVDDLNLLEVGVNGLLMANRNGTLAPYLLAGVGYLNVDSEIYSDDSQTAYSYGAGLQWRLGARPMAARLEYRVRDASEKGLDFDDAIISLGIRFDFGRTEMPTPAVAPQPQDSDGDGVNDTLDQCPNTPAGERVDARGCPLDSDGDGVSDSADACPNTVRGAAVDARGCELDDDGDGIVNRLDRCPNTPAGVRVDVNGCEIRDVIDLPGVNFETNSDRLLPGAETVLGDAAATLRRYPDLVVEVAGHTDSQGADDYNAGLSERRALTVRDYLVRAGVPGTQLSVRGYGESMPVADNGTADGRARNRRVELRIVQQ